MSKETSQKTLSDGTDIYSVILTELDCLPTLSYAKQLVHCLYYLLEPGLFKEIIAYLDVSLIPAVLARITERFIDDEDMCLHVSTIISTISQSLLYALYVMIRRFSRLFDQRGCDRIVSQTSQ